MKNILIVAIQPQRFLDQISFARNITKKTSEVKIYFFINHETYVFYTEIVNSLEFKIINKLEKKEFKRTNKNFLKEIIKNRLSAIQQRQIIKYINAFMGTKLFVYKLKHKECELYDNLMSEYHYLFNLIEGYNIDVIFINGDRHLGSEPAFLKVAKDLNISTIIPYMVYFSEEEGLVKSSTVNVSNYLFSSEYIKQLEEKFIYHKREGKYYYSHTVANALDRFGVLTKNPWFMGSGYSDILCLPNNQMKKHYSTHGVDLNKIKVIGDTSYDQLYIKYKKYKKYKKDENIKIILEKYNLNKKKKVVIIALPQLGEHYVFPWERHWEEINFLMKCLDNLNQNILISLHPKMDKNKYQFLEGKYNCSILDERLIDVLPIADMFVATFSSTVVWSTLCGITRCSTPTTPE